MPEELLPIQLAFLPGHGSDENFQNKVDSFLPAIPSLFPDETVVICYTSLDHV